MLNPRSIAIVGATPRMQYGGRFLAAALKAKDRVRAGARSGRQPADGEQACPGAAADKEKLAGGGWWLLGNRGANRVSFVPP
jgi:uncharacterized protein YbjT (DUF2867 family)